jgi:hypothetical protein
MVKNSFPLAFNNVTQIKAESMRLGTNECQKSTWIFPLSIARNPSGTILKDYIETMSR